MRSVLPSMDAAGHDGVICIDMLSCAALVLGKPVDDVDLQKSFVVNGGDSLRAILLQSMLREHGYKITREDLLTSPTIGDVFRDGPGTRRPLDQATSWVSSSNNSHPDTDSSGRASSSSAASSSPVSASQWAGSLQSLGEAHLRAGQATDGSHRNQVYDLLTELQLSLVHETITHCGSNIITYSEFHHRQNAETYRKAWIQVLNDEAIFKRCCLGPLFSKQGRAADADVPGLTLDGLTGLGSEWPGWSLEMCRAGKTTADGMEELMEITFKVHHALIDASSLEALVSKVRARANGMQTKPGTSFWDWALLLRHHQQDHKAEGDKFWAQTMVKHPDAKGHMALPTPARTLQFEAQLERHDFSVNAEAIKVRARGLGVTPAAIFYAGWALVVATYADSDSVVFGSVLSGRGLGVPDSLNAIGPLINVLPLHVAVCRDAPLRDFVWGLFVDTVNLEALAWTSTENGFRRDYESALSVQLQLPEAVDGSHPAANTYQAMPVSHSSRQQSRVPISVTVKDASRVTIDFHSSRYGSRDARLVADCYERALDMMLTVDGKVDDAMQGLLSCQSYSQLMRWGNCITGLTTKASVKDDLVTLFEAAAEANSQRTALEKGDRTMTYAELQTRSTAICDVLAPVVTEGDVVCVHSDRSLEWICAIWGILKAGCTYCSLDPQLTAAWRESMVEAVSATAFITATTEQLDEWRPRHVRLAFSVESVPGCAQADASTTTPVPRTPRPHRPAYICFTSGSTGVPKPVVCTHAGLVAFQRDPTVRLGATPGVRVSQIMSVAFDGSIHEIFSALTYGATLVLPACSRDVLSVLGKVDSAVFTPSIARALQPADFPGLQTVYLVGEPVPQAVADAWSACKDVYNMYGPTEATCGATIKRLRSGQDVNIGRPNPSTRVYVLNSSGGLSQPGMVGRIHLAGVQVSRGYHGMPEQTGAVFRPDQVMGNGEMSYDTGDMGYWDEHGDLVCVGRRDRQVKLRGYRVELNDLEIRIAETVPEADAVAVAVRKGLVDELLVMVQPGGLDIAAMRSRLEATFPRYLLPGHIVAVDTIPTTPAGKIDYKAIAQVEIGTDAAVAPSAPAAGTEEVVAAAFCAVLQRPAARWPIDRSQSLGELGGHSMEQIKLARHLAKTLGIPVSLRTVISNPSIKALAGAIDQSRAGLSLASATTETPPVPESVTPIEADWLEKYRVSSGTSCFNVSSLHRFEPDRVDVDRLERALNGVLQRHPVLRGTYISSRAPRRPEYRRILTRHYPRVQRLRTVDVWLELNRPFQPHQEHPVRVVLADDTLLVVMSHIAADYTALATVLREASALYTGAELPVPSAGAAYPAQQLCGVELTEETKKYWLSTLSDVPAPCGIFSSVPRRTSYLGRSIVYELDKATSRQILACRSSHFVSLQHLGMAAVVLGLVNQRPGEPKDHVDVMLGVPYINRGSTEQMETVGLFLQPLPVRIKYDRAPENLNTLLREVQQATQAALARGLPWHQLLNLARCIPDYPDHPLFDVMVSFHEPEMIQQLRMDIPTLEPCFAWSSGAKFKMMCEFTAVAGDCVVLRVEYDDGCINEESLRGFVEDVAAALHTLTSRSDARDPASSQRRGRLTGGFRDEKTLLGRRLSDWANLAT
ncbi:NRPS [Pyricularia oryzae]|nr:NRPS [Pyricularia oryzae]KAI6486464.1 NRPS [Pyricularia oryzae]